ncbi:MAG: archaemetzincin family Zn-dependent metalloprotease [Promethearchaeota archaeon]|jgi:archaemetzincin
MKRIVCLQKIGSIRKEVLSKLKSKLESTFSSFNFKLKINPVDFILQDADYNSEREQFNATKILKKLGKNSRGTHSFRILGVIDEDIYRKNSNFVFGLANKTSGVALISLTRLRERFYLDKGGIHRQEESEELFDKRILKEAIHELGHTFGLPHCKNRCIMQRSTSLADTDNKPKEFCESCFTNLEGFFTKLNLNSY